MFSYRRDDDVDYEQRATDAMLRSGGFKIKHRPANAEPVWEKGGWEYTETEAWAELNRRICEGRK